MSKNIRLDTDSTIIIAPARRMVSRLHQARVEKAVQSRMISRTNTRVRNTRPDDKTIAIFGWVA